MPEPGWGMAMTAGQSHGNGQTAATGPDANRRSGMLSGTRIDEETTEKIGTVIRRRPADDGPEPPFGPIPPAPAGTTGTGTTTWRYTSCSRGARQTRTQPGPRDYQAG